MLSESLLKRMAKLVEDMLDIYYEKDNDAFERINLM